MIEILSSLIEELRYSYLGNDKVEDIDIRLPKDMFDRILYDLTSFPTVYFTRPMNPLDVVSFQFNGINIIKK